MKKLSIAAGVILTALFSVLLAPFSAIAQNVAIVNGKPVPMERVDALIAKAVKQGQARTPDLERNAREEAVRREILMQEAEKRGLAKSLGFKQEMELARQGILMLELFNSYTEKNRTSDAEVAAEYEKYMATARGIEYHSRHILVEKENDAIALIKQIKAGAKFEELAKKSSRDPGSAVNGGDLGFANPNSFVPEFSAALVKLKKGEMTNTPVKTQFGYHIIKLDETRETQLAPLAQVKVQITQALDQRKLAKFRDEIISKAKTDFKFSN